MKPRRAGKRSPAGKPRYKPNYAKSKSRKSLWTPFSGITQTGLSKWLQCPEQFALSYIEGVTAKSISEPLEFGSLFHLCCEFAGKASPESVVKSCCDAYLAARQPNVDHSEYDKLQKLATVIRVIFPAYARYWEKNDAKLHWVSREKPFSVPYQFVTHANSRYSINLVGKRDGVFRDTKGNLCLFETKTKSEIKADEIRDGLKADFQTMFYLLALYIETGTMPREILYNVVRRPRQHWTKTDTMKTYTAKIEADIKKRPTHYFARWRVHLNPNSLPRFQQLTLDPALRNLLSWWGSIEKNPFDRFQSPFHLLNLPALTGGRYGRSDLYHKIVNGQRTGYYCREVLFPELNEYIPVKIKAA